MAGLFERRSCLRSPFGPIPGSRACCGESPSQDVGLAASGELCQNVDSCRNCDSNRTFPMTRVNSGARRSRFAVVVTLLAASASLRAEVPSAIAIKDARVVTVSGEDLPRATVLLRDGLIQDVGAGLAIPQDAWVIDGIGLTVYPGFIDGLSHWGLAPVTNPVPAVRARGPEDRPQTYSFERAADRLDPQDHRLEAVRAAGFTAAATFPDRGIFEGLGAMIGLAGGEARDMVIAQPIGQQVMFRITRGPARSGYPASLMGNIAYVRQLYLDLD